MKQYDKVERNPEEAEFDGVTEEMDIFFGNLFGATTMVETHLENNFPHYCEGYPFSIPQENQGNVRHANDVMKLYSSPAPSKKVPQ